MKGITKKIPVVILAGGKGAPLGAASRVIPKPMIDINGKPLILYIIDHYIKYGFKKIIICTGLGSEMVERFVGSSDYLKRSGLDLSVVNTGPGNMTGSRIAQIRAKVNNADNFCVTYGDSVSDVNLARMLDFHISHGKIATLLGVHAPI
ncbi:MAG: NTP transferase domain-containing protein, partial [Candidatus Omnitrophica bacterium]|nr:NTP transferase domain-containing protein [Candidatus Omnitrophota bacterium]